MPQLKLLSLFSLGLLFLAAPSFAASVSQDGATALQQRFTKEITTRKDIKMAGSSAAFTGDVKVLPKNDYYEVTLPDLKLTDAKNNKFNVGKIVMNMMPTDNDNEWKSSVALPSTLSYLDAAGKNPSKLSLGSQKASGLWDMGMFGFKKLNASYGNVTFRNDATKQGTAIANVNIDYNLTKADGGFSGPVNVTANDITFIDTNDQKSPLAQSLKVNSQMTADKSAKTGYTQTSQAEISGLSNAVNLIGTKLKDPAQQGKAQLQKTLGILSVLQMSGKPVAGNEDLRSYTVSTDAQGRTLLNGVDVSLLLTAASVK